MFLNICMCDYSLADSVVCRIHVDLEECVCMDGWMGVSQRTEEKLKSCIKQGKCKLRAKIRCVNMNCFNKSKKTKPT